MTARSLPCLCVVLALLASAFYAQAPAQSSSSSSKRTTKLARAKPTLDPGSVTNNIYRNKTLGFICTIPPAWVLRTDEMNARDAEIHNEDTPSSGPAPAAGKVLLAAFSRPPATKGEDVNSSIVIAAEPVATYPGLKDPAQYFGPLTEVAKGEGFSIDQDPYEIAIGPKTLVRSDFHKDVGTRVMRQSTLALLSHGYAISITLIAGTADEIEELIDALTFTVPAK